MPGPPAQGVLKTALRPKDVDLDYGTLTVQHGKGDKRRVVGLDAGTIALISRWLEVRRRLPAGTPLARNGLSTHVRIVPGASSHAPRWR